VPGLGFKRGLGDDLVVAPYATALAAMVEPVEALRNFERLASVGALGRYGFYESIDYTRSRLPEDEAYAFAERKIAELHPNTPVKLAIIRYGEKREVDMKLGTFPNSKKLASVEEDKPDTGQQMKDLGMSLAPAAKFPGAGDEGVVITEVPPTRA
jgi:hypothetical protein